MDWPRKLEVETFMLVHIHPLRGKDTLFTNGQLLVWYQKAKGMVLHKPKHVVIMACLWDLPFVTCSSRTSTSTIVFHVL